MKKLLLTIFIISSFFTPILRSEAHLPETASSPIKILLVPGHDEEVWGAQYGNIKESTMTLSLAKRIYDVLKKDKRFEVHITRDSKGYVKAFSDYFANKDEINSFKDNAKKETQAKIKSGEFTERKSVDHNTASADTAVVLYGINKWANENKMDAVIHIHFNDYPRTGKWAIGKYKGFAVYFPDSELENWMESSQIAADIFTQLRKKYATSTYGEELGGLVPDQKLIALGSNGTLLPSVRSVLVEYGYIYEKKFRTSSPRIQAYNNMANLTATGIKKYFFPK